MEVKDGINVQECTDNDYLKDIICKIGCWNAVWTFFYREEDYEERSKWKKFSIWCIKNITCAICYSTTF